MAWGRKTGTNTRGDLWREPEHPGHKNAKEAARGGTRRQVARDAALDAITRNPVSKSPLVKKGGDAAGQKLTKAQKRVQDKPLTRKRSGR